MRTQTRPLITYAFDMGASHVERVSLGADSP